VPGASGERVFEQKLWQLAEANTPDADVATYTQAIMDLGATLCMRRRPQCSRCPLAARCVAHAQGEVERYPAPKRPLQRRRVERWMLFARRADGAVQLVQRPPQGVWGGLWSPPEFESMAAAREATGADAVIQEAPALQHAFTHFDLTIHPLWFVADADAATGALWYNAAAPAQIGLPAPIAALLATAPKEP
jgi:A/G-specific adenine glycosylase